MRKWLPICAASLALVVAPGASGERPGATASEGVFAVAGACVWAPNARESALGAAFIGEAAASLVQSFAAALQAAASGATRISSATLLLDPERHQCIQFVRGALSVSADEASTAAALPGYFEGVSDGARTLFANGIRLSSQPDLIAEVRLHTIRESADGNRLIVLEPSFIGYRKPLFRQTLRFWDGDERTFALQLQLAEAPDAPTQIASGGQLHLGTRRPSHERLHISMPDAEDEGVPSPGSSLAFQVENGELYNARISVAESSSASAFMTFWANVIATTPVQTAASAALQDTLSEERRESARRAAYATYAGKRGDLGALLNSCPIANNEAANAWVMTERAELVQTIGAYLNAAEDAGVATDALPQLAQEGGTAEIVAWCRDARAFLQRH